MPSAKEEIDKWAVFANLGSEYERAGITSFIDKHDAEKVAEDTYDILLL